METHVPLLRQGEEEVVLQSRGSTHLCSVGSGAMIMFPVAYCCGNKKSKVRVRVCYWRVIHTLTICVAMI